MTTPNNVIDSADLIVEVKALEKVIVEKFDELEAHGKQVKEEIAALGEASNESKAKSEELVKQYDELYERLQAVEQRGATLELESGPESLGDQFIKSDQFKAMAEGRATSARLDVKTAIVNATGASQPLVQADRLGGIAQTPDRVLTIRDVLPVSTTGSNLVEFTREASFTNNAGPQIGGSPEQYENVTKPESGITFSLVSEPVVTLAHFIPASKQVMGDSAALASHINSRLMYGLKLKEETQLLSGTGANHQLNGLITQATAYTVQSPNLDNEIDIIRDAIKQAHVAEYRPDFVCLSPVDWYDIETRKVGSSDDRYVVGNPNMMHSHNIWGLPVVVTNSIAAGTFLLGSSLGAEIKDREQASVAVSFEEGNNFTKNMVTVLAEERLALCVYRTEAFITGSL